LLCRPGVEYICADEIIVTPTVASVPTSPVNTIIRRGVEDSTIFSNKIGMTNESDLDEDHHENGEGYSDKEDGKNQLRYTRTTTQVATKEDRK
jgi:hypothetical protein